MAVSSTGYLNVNLFKDLLANASPELNLLGGSGKLYGLEADNSQNTSAVYVKLYNSAAPLVGTDAPEWVFKVAAGKKRFQPLGSRGTGRSFATALSFACVTAGGTGGSTSPTNPVKLTLATD